MPPRATTPTTASGSSSASGLQSTPDIFLGWTRGPGGRDFYGSLCAQTLARAHARSGDTVAIAAYLGTSDTFDGAIADLSETYADQNQRDYQAFQDAIASGRIEAAAG